MSVRILLLIVCLNLSGCSWITKFAISNKTDNDLAISITVKTYNHAKTKEVICPIIKWPKLELSNDNLWYFNTGHWVEFPRNRQVVDSLNCIIEFDLKSGESVVIANAGTYTGSQEGEEVIDVLKLKIEQQDKSATYKGVELLESFEKVDDTLYVLSIVKI